MPSGACGSACTSAAEIIGRAQRREITIPDALLQILLVEVNEHLEGESAGEIERMPPGLPPGRALGLEASGEGAVSGSDG